MSSNPASGPPPGDVHMIERTLLGVMLRSSGVIPTVRQRLDLSDYALESSRILARRLYTFSEENIPSNVVAVISGLTQEDLQRVGGPSYVASLPDGIPVVDDAGLNYYCEVIKRKSLDRQIERINEEIRHDIADGEKPSVALERYLAKLNELHALYGAASAPAEVEIGCTLAELEESEPAETEWIARGFVGPGIVVELVARVKEGKTLWAMALTRACAFGGDFLGRYVSPCRVLYLTEQPKASFTEQAREAGILGSSDIHVIFHHEVASLSWEQVVALAVKKAIAFKAKMLVIDTFSRFANFDDKGENDSGEAQRKMNPLCNAAAISNLAVLSLRHGRKGGGDIADAARGSGVISGNADIILYLQATRSAGKFCRELTTRGRYHETPDECVIELAGAHYRLVNDSGAIKQDRAKAAILAALPTAPALGQTILDVARKLSMGVETVRPILQDFSQASEIERTGSGRKGNAFRFRHPAPPSPYSQTDFWENSAPPTTATTKLEENFPIPPDSPNATGKNIREHQGSNIPLSPEPIGLRPREDEIAPGPFRSEDSVSGNDSSSRSPKSIGRENGEKREW